MAKILEVYMIRGSLVIAKMAGMLSSANTTSVDNIFIFLIIFKYFAVPREARHRVLFWGVLGALVMRGFMIFSGVLLLQRFEWLIYVFGAFLVFTGLKMLKHGDTEIHPEHNPVLKLVRRFIPMQHDYEGAQFFSVRRKRS